MHTSIPVRKFVTPSNTSRVTASSSIALSTVLFPFCHVCGQTLSGVYNIVKKWVQCLRLELKDMKPHGTRVQQAAATWQPVHEWIRWAEFFNGIAAVWTAQPVQRLGLPEQWPTVVSRHPD